MASSDRRVAVRRRRLHQSRRTDTKEQGEYIRQRLDPEPGDLFYLHLSDLRLAFRKVETDKTLSILDYGAGFSPYRSLFRHCEYKRADIAATQFRRNEERLDYFIEADGTIPEESGSFDVVLTTQVAEHVYDADSYFAECLRLLKPGGELWLTTHGLYEEHDCPHDFRRWMSEGLKRDLEKAGFEIKFVDKLTTGSRAIMFLVERYLETTFISRKSLPGLVQWVCRVCTRKCRPWIHSLMDKHYSQHRVVAAEGPDHSMYVGLFVCAQRPLPSDNCNLRSGWL
jgi:SAM-dependent methyltransferase